MDISTKMIPDLEDLNKLKLKMSGCFLCSHILQDLQLHGELTGWPYSWSKEPLFPKASKLAHIDLERKCEASQNNT